MVSNNVDVISAIKRPFTNIKNLVIGLILFNVPIVNIFAPAYFFRCIRGTYMGHTFLPDWRDIKGFMKDWAIMLVIGLIYMVIPIGFFLIFSDSFSNLFTSIISPDISSISVITSLILSNKLFLLFILIVAIAVYLMNMTYLIVNDKKIKKINLNIIFKKAFTIRYFIGFVLITIIEVILGSMISIVPIVGQGTGNFLLGVISFTLYAQIYLTISK